MAKKKSNYSRLIGYVLPSYGFFLISFIGFFIFAGSQVAIAEWFRQIVDFVSNPKSDQYLFCLLPWWRWHLLEELDFI